MREIWVTGCGLLTALGEGEAAVWTELDAGSPAARVDSAAFAPFHVHPIDRVDFDRYIPKKGDQRAMGPLMLYGVHAAGMALEAAGVAGNAALLGRMHLLAASCGGERDIALDEQVLGVISRDDDPALNEQLANGLRPTLFLAQLPNLFAGNISIVHGVAGSSRTFMGEESAGTDAARIAFERIAAGQGDLFLVGGAYNASRRDMLLMFRPADLLLTGPFAGLWRRPAAGMCLGSVGAFLVFEASDHAERRGAAPLARLLSVSSDRSNRSPGSAAATASRQWRALAPMLTAGPVALISGACGAGPATAEEHAFLAELAAQRPDLAVRGTAGALGHSLEAAFLVNLILAISCMRRRTLFAPLAPDDALEARRIDGPVAQAVVTGWGHRRGEGMALVAAVD